MVVRTGVLLVCCVGVFSERLIAQRPVNPQTANGRQLIQQIDSLLDSPEKALNQLRCRVERLDPVLNFTFRYQAGYHAEIPVTGLEAANEILTIRLRVKPSSGQPASYFQEILKLPPIPEGRRRLRITTSGGFYLGEGEYQVDWLLSSSQGLTCAKKFRLKLKLSSKERERLPFLQPGHVTALRRDPWKGTDDGRRPYRVAVLLHASPMYPLGSVLTWFDQSLLLSTLRSLFENTPFRETSVVAFNLQEQRVIFRAERLRNRSFGQLLDVMDDLKLGAVRVENLRNPMGASEMLAGVVNRIFDHSEMPDALIFVGPNTVVNTPFRDEWVTRGPDKPLPAVYYLHLDFFGRRFPFDDAVDHAVKSLDGHTFRIRQPSDLASALEKIEVELERRRLDRALQTPNTSR